MNSIETVNDNIGNGDDLAIIIRKKYYNNYHHDIHDDVNNDTENRGNDNDDI